MDDKKPTPKPEPPPPLEGLPVAPDWMLSLATACIILGVVIVIVILAGCAPPPAHVTLDAGMFDNPVIPYIWQGADHPEWASCRYEPPSALCTE